MEPATLTALAERIAASGRDQAAKLGSDARLLLAPASDPSPAPAGNPALSLDACRALHERVLPDWQPTITFGSPMCHVALHRNGRPVLGATGQASSPELAWLAAMLRTLAGSRW